MISLVTRTMKLLLIPKAWRISYKQEAQIPFLKLAQAPIGLLNNISEQEKRNINLIVDKRLQQLQDTGLSRQQLLFEEAPPGIPLRIDPFYQYIKNNHIARQIYLKAGEQFNVQKIVDIALRQELGPDPSYSLQPAKEKTIHNKPLESMNQNIFKSKNFKSDQSSNIQHIHQQLNKLQPIKYIYPVLSRRKKLQSQRRILKDYQIHWRNTQLLAQFIDQHGNIIPRTKSCLSRIQHKKIIKAIKIAKSMLVLPNRGQVNPIFKKPLRNLEEQIQNETGHIVLKRMTSHVQDQLRKQQMNVQKKMLKRYKKTFVQIWFDYQQQKDQKKINIYKLAAVHARKRRAKQLQQNGIDVAALKRNSANQQKNIDKVYERIRINDVLDNLKDDEIKAEQAEQKYKMLKDQIKQQGYRDFVRLFLRQKISCN